MSKFQSFKESETSTFHFMCLIELDPVSKTIKRATSIRDCSRPYLVQPFRTPVQTDMFLEFPDFCNFEILIKHFGIISGSFWDHFGIILRSFWDHFGIILESFCDHFGISLGSFWDHFGIIFGILLESFWNHSGIILGSF